MKLWIAMLTYALVNFVGLYFILEANEGLLLNFEAQTSYSTQLFRVTVWPLVLIFASWVIFIPIACRLTR